MVVLARIGVVEVQQLRHVDHPIMGLLQYRYADGYIIGCHEVFTLIILKISFIDIKEKLSEESTEMAGNKGIASIPIFSYGFPRERTGVAHISTNRQEITIDEPHILRLID